MIEPKMNRAQRRATESAQKKNVSGHQTQSFAEHVSAATINRVKGFIEEQMQVVQGQLARAQMQSQAQMQTRMMALEEIIMEKLGETEATISDRIARIEDDATGYVESKEPAQNLDFVRVTLQGRVFRSEDTEFGPEKKLEIRALGRTPIQTYTEIENALLGKVKGDEVMVVVTPPGSLPTKNEDGTETPAEQFEFKIKVDRVSTKISTLEARKAMAEKLAQAATTEFTPAEEVVNETENAK